MQGVRSSDLVFGIFHLILRLSPVAGCLWLANRWFVSFKAKKIKHKHEKKHTFFKFVVVVVVVVVVVYTKIDHVVQYRLTKLKLFI